ncbi:hypothetical protein PV325_003449 [Microctonus aethiopoides]|nr:hypothetical protein PV325_003449 [Microctonus aethiopoides]
MLGLKELLNRARVNVADRDAANTGGGVAILVNRRLGSVTTPYVIDNEKIKSIETLAVKINDIMFIAAYKNPQTDLYGITFDEKQIAEAFADNFEKIHHMTVNFGGTELNNLIKRNYARVADLDTTGMATLSEVFENVIVKKIRKYLDENKCCKEAQFGFRTGH